MSQGVCVQRALGDPRLQRAATELMQNPSAVWQSLTQLAQPGAGEQLMQQLSAVLAGSGPAADQRAGGEGPRAVPAPTRDEL